MRFFKGKKGIIISFIIGVILASSITVYATTYFASDVVYKDGKSVASALDELYTKASTYKSLSQVTTVDENKLLNGITAYNSDGKLVTGTFESGVASNTFTFQSNYSVPVGFRPSFVCIYIEDVYSNVNAGTAVIYNGTKWIAINANANHSGTYVSNASNFSITDNGFRTEDLSGWGEVNRTVSYVAIK